MFFVCSVNAIDTEIKVELNDIGKIALDLECFVLCIPHKTPYRFLSKTPKIIPVTKNSYILRNDPKKPIDKNFW